MKPQINADKSIIATENTEYTEKKAKNSVFSVTSVVKK